MRFGPEGLSCSAVEPKRGVVDVACENLDDKTLAVSLLKLSSKEGSFEFKIGGMKNPPNFRRSALFSNIYMTTNDYYSMQKLDNYADLWIQTNTPATIVDFTRL